MKTEKRWAKVGEEILIINASGDPDEPYKNGDILKVSKELWDTGDVELECWPEGFVKPDEYEVIIEAGTERDLPPGSLTYWIRKNEALQRENDWLRDDLKKISEKGQIEIERLRAALTDANRRFDLIHESTYPTVMKGQAKLGRDLSAEVIRDGK